MAGYAIGLDVGITSVGWAAVALDNDERPMGILNLGSRIFTAAENPKTGDSLAAPRRKARSSRRRLRRRHHRNERIRYLLTSTGLLTQEQLSCLFDGKLDDIYALRVKALDSLITDEELARIMLHLSQRRGFRSNRKNAKVSEDGKILEAVSANQQRMRDGNYRTVGEMLLKDVEFADHKRNKGGEYITTVTRDMITSEVHAVFSAQRSFGNASASAELESAYLDILLSQRSFDDGPGGNSPYGGNQIERMIGKCTLCPEELRAAKATYSFEYFNLLEKLNHIRIQMDGESEALSPSQRKTIIELAHKTEKLDFAKLRNALDLVPDATFNMVQYRKDQTQEESEKKESFCYLKAFHAMRRAIDRNGKGRFVLLSMKQRDAIGYALSVYKTSDKIQTFLEAEGVELRDIEALEEISGFSKFGHLSVKACRALIPFLEQGMKYNDACTAAGFEFKGHSDSEKQMLLHPSEDDYDAITSPVVKRAISQSIKVINAIIRNQGTSPTFINIELAREMAKDFSERNRMKKDMDENRGRNEQIKEEIEKTYRHQNPTGLDIVKLKLFKEQDGRCAYSLKSISAERLFEPNYVEIDHIIPYSISFDDSYKNKVLVLAEENRNKGNRIPLQYLTGKRREDFIVWVNSSVRDYKKRTKLLTEKISDETGFKERNLQDTKTISVFLLNYLNDNLRFAPSAIGRKKRVTAVNGAVTSYLRKRWGITKVREDGDLHHAVDATVIACTTDAMIQQVSRYSASRECQYVQGESFSAAVNPETGEVIREFPYPWDGFRKELEARTADDPTHFEKTLLSLPAYRSGVIPMPTTPVFVSRMPHRTVTGAAHKDTIKSARILDEGCVITKRPLTDLKLKNGEIENYYNPGSDRLLYEALIKRLAEYDGDGKKAFATPFYKPKSDGTPGPEVKKVKICEPTTLNVAVHGGNGVADNDSMVRIDVFHVENDGYYLVPIYVADTMKPELPNRAVVAGKPFAEWKEMRDTDFIFSLYPNDLILVTHKSKFNMTVANTGSTLQNTIERKTALLYYIKSSISTAAITCVTNDNTYAIASLGIKTLAKLEKYTVDVLGNYHKVGKETRQPFHMKRG